MNDRLDDYARNINDQKLNAYLSDGDALLGTLSTFLPVWQDFRTESDPFSIPSSMIRTLKAQSIRTCTQLPFQNLSSTSCSYIQACRSKYRSHSTMTSATWCGIIICEFNPTRTKRAQDRTPCTCRIAFKKEVSSVLSEASKYNEVKFQLQFLSQSS